MKNLLEKIFGFLCEHLLLTIILIGFIGFLMVMWTIPILENLINLEVIILASLSLVAGIFLLGIAIIAFTFYISSL